MNKSSFNTVGELRDILSCVKDEVSIAILDMKGSGVWRFTDLNCSLTNFRGTEWVILLFVEEEKEGEK